MEGSKPCPHCGKVISANKDMCAEGIGTGIPLSTFLHQQCLAAATKIESIESDIRRAMRGEIATITCPYCGKQNYAGNDSLCCADFGLVVRAVLRKQAQQDILDTAARVAEKAAAIGLLN